MINKLLFLLLPTILYAQSSIWSDTTKDKPYSCLQQKQGCCLDQKGIDSLLGKTIWFLQEGRVQRTIVHNIILSDSTTNIYATVNLGSGWLEYQREINLSKTIWSTDSLQQQIEWTRRVEDLDNRIKLRKKAQAQMRDGQKTLDSLDASK